MKIIQQTYAVLFAVALMGCSNKDLVPNTDIDIPLDPNQKYIHFDADVSTRGALVEGTVLEDNFAVLGYQYPGTWEAENVLASPNVFDTTPQIVKYQDGIYTYETSNGTPKVWTGNRYSFFGYYPSDHGSIKLFDNGTVKQGVPYIMYTFPPDSDPRTHIDVMTASYIDTGVASSSSVQMHFRHRLCAVDVGARNYYTLDHDNDTSTDDKLVTIEITLLTAAISNITNTEAKIYLDHTIPTEYPNAQTKASINYEVVGASEWAPDTFDVQPNTASDRAIRLISHTTGENASSLLFIPQEELLLGVVTLYYRKKYVDDDGITKYQRINFGENNETYYTWTELPTDPNALTYYTFKPDLNIDFDKKLIEGRRYYIELTFTSDAVSVNIVAADEWDDKGDINHEFD